MRVWCASFFILATVGCSGSDASDAGFAPDAAAPLDAQAQADAEVDAGHSPPDAGMLDTGVPPGTWAEVEVVLRVECSPCHDPGNRDGRTVVRDYANIVDQLSGRYPLVVPGDPEASFLHAKVANETSAYCARQMPPGRDCGRSMPPGPNRRPLTPAEVELIRSWIEAGALEN